MDIYNIDIKIILIKKKIWKITGKSNLGNFYHLQLTKYVFSFIINNTEESFLLYRFKDDFNF